MKKEEIEREKVRGKGVEKEYRREGKEGGGGHGEE